jgi:quercetin dioxygenase-like cupin family protein
MAIRHKVIKAEEIKRGMVRGSDDLSERNWLYGKGITQNSFAGIWTHKSGCRLPMEGWKWHDEAEIEYIVQGKMRLLIADSKGIQKESYLLEEGDLFYIGKGVKHAAEIVGRKTCIGLLFCPKCYKLPNGQPAWSDKTPDPAGWIGMNKRRTKS